MQATLFTTPLKNNAHTVDAGRHRGFLSEKTYSSYD
jgi:hypothetical protein